MQTTQGVAAIPYLVRQKRPALGSHRKQILGSLAVLPFQYLSPHNTAELLALSPPHPMELSNRCAIGTNSLVFCSSV
jgi:hypothetical protein